MHNYCIWLVALLCFIWHCFNSVTWFGFCLCFLFFALMSFILEFSHGSCLVMWFLCPPVFLLLGPLFIVMFWLVVLVLIGWFLSCDPFVGVYIVLMWPLSLVVYWCCNLLSVSLLCSCQVKTLFGLCLDFGLLLEIKLHFGSHYARLQGSTCNKYQLALSPPYLRDIALYKQP